MPVILRVLTAQFEFTVWCNDIAKRQHAYQQTLSKRDKAQLSMAAAQGEDIEVYQNKASVRFSPPLLIQELAIAEVIKNEAETSPFEKTAEINLNNPSFFENIRYQFSWDFFEDVEEAQLAHRSYLVNEGFRFAKARRSIPARLTGTIDTRNDVGWMRLPLEYVLAGQTIKSNISFEVLPTKIDMHRDLPAMYEPIDQNFPLWRFSLVGKTEQDTAKGQVRGHFPLLWLANFGHLREQFERGLKVIAQAPHSRLQPFVLSVKADRLKGRLSHRLIERVKEDLANGRQDKRYQPERKRLSVDTPENRFIKMTVSTCKRQLADFERKLRDANKVPDRQRLSDAFLDELHCWQQPLQKVLSQSFLEEVGTYSALSRESLVLQEKTGYSAVYRVWQELKFYLDVFGNHSSVSMKSVAEIYEVWCFLTLKNILVDELGFKDVTRQERALQLNEFLEYKLKDGFAGAFEFKRIDGVKARLVHEPQFTKKGKDIRSYLVDQKPDVVLEVQLAPPSGKRFIWLFDAKYRIKSDSRFGDGSVESVDMVPDDAINQMHRYRDALIRITRDNNSSEFDKSRPVFGAFALYPGCFDQGNEDNPYREAIVETGIGAFAMLPMSMEAGAQERTGHSWLSEFLLSQIGADPKTGVHYSTESLEEQFYVQEAARIPYYGMRQLLYPDLTMTVALGGKEGRRNEYFTAFDNGTAKCYHLPKNTFESMYKQHVVGEIRYLALAVTSDSDSDNKCIDKLWPVKRMSLVPRNTITEEQAGKESVSDDSFYLFELGKPLGLKDTIQSVPNDSFRASMKLTTLAKLESVQEFDEIKSVYQEVLV